MGSSAPRKGSYERGSAACEYRNVVCEGGNVACARRTSDHRAEVRNIAFRPLCILEQRPLWPRGDLAGPRGNGLSRGPCRARRRVTCVRGRLDRDSHRGRPHRGLTSPPGGAPCDHCVYVKDLHAGGCREGRALCGDTGPRRDDVVDDLAANRARRSRDTTTTRPRGRWGDARWRSFASQRSTAQTTSMRSWSTAWLARWSGWPGNA